MTDRPLPSLPPSIGRPIRMGPGSSNLRAIPGDPSGADVEMAVAGHEWLLTIPGDWQVFAARAFSAATGGFDDVVCIDLPVRANKTTEPQRFRVTFAPDDAVAIADHLRHAAGFARRTATASEPKHRRT